MNYDIMLGSEWWHDHKCDDIFKGKILLWRTWYPVGNNGTPKECNDIL